MHARVTTLDMDPSKVDEVRDRLEGMRLPARPRLRSVASGSASPTGAR
jgi:hypothetical protein